MKFHFRIEPTQTNIPRTDIRLVLLFCCCLHDAESPEVQKQLIGERLFPAISKYQPELAGKITGPAAGLERVDAMKQRTAR